MELHQVRYFLALARTLNFTRAAEQCNVTQPALTKAIQKLEHELGGDLIYRERQLTQLTDLGKLVFPMLEQAVAAADTARVQAKDFQEKEIAPLRIGLAPTVSASIIVEPLSELARVIPGLEIDISEHAADQMSDALLAGEIHAGIVGAQEPSSERIDHLPLFDERYVTIAARTHPFAELDTVPLPLVQDAVWLSRVGCDVSEQFRRTCFKGDAEPKIGHRAHQESHLQHMVAAGLGVMLAPEHAPRLPALVARPIEGDPVRRRVELLVMAGRRYSPALDAFVKIARLRDWQSAFDVAATAPAIDRHVAVSEHFERLDPQNTNRARLSDPDLSAWLPHVQLALGTSATLRERGI
jgi:DNA-binding transcriptional LysR family regulator